MIDLQCHSLAPHPSGCARDRPRLQDLNWLNIMSRHTKRFSHCRTKRAAYLVPIYPGRRVTQVQAFREIKDRVSLMAPHNAARVTAERTKWSFRVKWMFNWR